MSRNLRLARRDGEPHHDFIIIQQESNYPQVGSLYLSSALAEHGIIRTYRTGS